MSASSCIRPTSRLKQLSEPGRKRQLEELEEVKRVWSGLCQLQPGRGEDVKMKYSPRMHSCMRSHGVIMVGEHVRFGLDHTGKWEAGQVVVGR
jgi:hypothetical protein